MSSRLLSYRDAVRILDGSKSPIVAAVGRLASAAAAGATVASLGAVDFFALRDELIRWGHATVTGVQDRVSGLRRLDRTEKLVAAHAVLVVTAFFDALSEILEEQRGVGVDAAEITRAEQLTMVTGTSPGDGRSLYRFLLDTSLPMPEPHWPLESTLGSLTGLYENAAEAAVFFLGGLAAFDGQQEDLPTLRSQVVDRALERYSAAYRSLAADVPEFAAWVGLVDAQATRVAVQDASARVQTQLSGLTTGLRATVERLTTISGVAATEEVPRGLSTRHAEALRRPILASAQAPAM